MDAALAEHQITHGQSAIRGGQPSGKRLSLADFTIQMAQDGTPTTLTCPAGQTVDVEVGRKAGRFSVRFDAQQCAGCPLLGGPCPARQT